MKTFAAKEKRSALAIRRSQPSRFGYRGPEVKAQQAEISRILRSAGAQAKLTVGQPNDKHEQEANRVADQVTAMPDPKLQRQPENEEEEEVLQAKTNPGGTPTVTPSLESRIHAVKSSGQPLRDSTRDFFEPHFGTDFGNVKIHTDNDASIMSKELGAQAFTLGSHIYFNSDKFNPGNSEGKRLLAHELTHVMQHNSATLQGRLILGHRSKYAQEANRGITSHHIMRKQDKVYKKEDLRVLLKEIVGLEWANQSNCKNPIRLTKGLIMVIRMVTPLSIEDVKLLWLKPPKTPSEVLKNIDNSLPATISESAMKKLEEIRFSSMIRGRIPRKETKKSIPVPAKKDPKVVADAKTIKEIHEAISNSLKDKKPEDKDENTEKLKEALKKTVKAFFKTEMGEKVKDMALSKKGIPLVLTLGTGALAALITENSDIPNTPEITLTDNLSLEIEFEGTFHSPKSFKLLLKGKFGGPSKQEEKKKKLQVIELPPELHTFIGKIDKKNNALSKWIVDRAFYEKEMAGPREEESKKTRYQQARDAPASVLDVQLVAKVLSRKLIEKSIENKINQLKGKELQKQVYFDLGHGELWNGFYELKGLPPILARLLSLLIPKVPYKGFGIKQVTFICGEKLVPVRVKR